MVCKVVQDGSNNIANTGIVCEAIDHIIEYNRIIDSSQNGDQVNMISRPEKRRRFHKPVGTTTGSKIPFSSDCEHPVPFPLINFIWRLPGLTFPYHNLLG